MVKVMALAGLLLFCGCTLGVEGLPGPAGRDGTQGPPGPPGDGNGAPLAVTGSRLVARYRHYTQAGDDGSLSVTAAQQSSLWDTERNEYCGWQTAEDFVIRCLPDVSSGYEAFRDASCADEVRILHKPPCGASGVPDYFAVPGASACAGPAFYARGSDAVPDGDYWFVTSSGTCIASMYHKDEYRGWTLGAHVLPTEFQSGQAREEVITESGGDQ